MGSGNKGRAGQPGLVAESQSGGRRAVCFRHRLGLNKILVAAAAEKDNEAGAGRRPGQRPAARRPRIPEELHLDSPSA